VRFGLVEFSQHFSQHRYPLNLIWREGKIQAESWVALSWEKWCSLRNENIPNKACWQISDIGRLAGNCTQRKVPPLGTVQDAKGGNGAKHSASHSDFGDVGFVGVLR